MNPCPKNIIIRLKGKKKTEFRKAVAKRALEFCEVCGGHAPRLWGGYFNSMWCGHIHHIKSVGSGGGDTMGENGTKNNAQWLCASCHRAKHDGKR